GGIGVTAPDGDPLISNCIFYENAGASGAGASAQVARCAAGGVATDLRVDFSFIDQLDGGVAGIGNLGAPPTDEPGFVDVLGPDGLSATGDEDLRLRGDAPCVDAGDTQRLPAALSSDRDGLPRIAGIVDIGAYERLPDADGDGTPDDVDGCPLDPGKVAPGACGCGVSDDDLDGDGVPDCEPVSGGVLDITFWYGPYQLFGVPGRPQHQMNVLGTVTSLHGVASLTSTVNGGPAQTLGVGPDDRRLVGDGDFNIELFFDDLPVGVHEVAVRAVDTQGQELVRVVTIEHLSDQVWPLPFSIAWSSIDRFQDVVDIADGVWELKPDGLRCVAPGYDRLVVLGDVTWQDYEIVLPITVHAIDESGYEWPSLFPAVGLTLRWPGHSDLHNPGAQPREGWWPFGALGQYVYRLNGCGPRLELYGPPYVQRDEDGACAVQLEMGITYMWRMRVRTTAVGHAYDLKVWPQAASEPEAWQLQSLEPPGEQASGSIAILAHHVEVTIGDVQVAPIE
ncbi:MAG: hypothetical protein ACYTGC_17515, partial [Planctomycetota bacterium]